MAGKRDRRRQVRRKQHQANRQQQRREQRQAVDAAIVAVRSAFAALRSASGDDGVSPVEFADRALELAGEPACARLLGDKDYACAQAAEMAEVAGEQRVALLAAELVRRVESAPPLVWLALGFAGECADLPAAEQLLAETLERIEAAGRSGTPEAAAIAATLGRLVMDQGRLGDAFELLDPWCASNPADDELQRVRAWAAVRTSWLWLEQPRGEPNGASSGGLDLPGWPQPAPEQLATAAAHVERFTDRSLLYELRAAVEEFVAADPELAAWRDGEVVSFLEEVRTASQLGPFDSIGADGRLRLRTGDGAAGASGDEGPEDAEVALRSFAAECCWVRVPDTDTDTDTDTENDDDDHDDDDASTILGRFAAAPGTPDRLADAARSWLAHARYGLWQPLVPDPGTLLAESFARRGQWVTDLLSRERLFCAFAPEQLEGVARWSVLVCAVAPIEGVWRSGATALLLDPEIADRAAEAVQESTELLVYHLARERHIRAPKPRRRDIDRVLPHGVLADLEPSSTDLPASLLSKVCYAELADLVAMVEASHRRSPRMSNSDGDPIEIFSVSYPAEDVHAVRSRLLAMADFEGDEGERPAAGEMAGPLRWLGREMTASEVASSLAQFRSEARKRGWGPVGEQEGTRRWLRGSVRFAPGEVRAEVNSRRRLEALSEALRRAGAGEAKVERTFDPALDLPAPGRLYAGTAPGDEEAETEWREIWLDDALPALAGRTPRAAVRDPRGVVLLESLLRSFEHAADLAAARGARPLDVASIRRELGLSEGILGLGFESEEDLDDADEHDEEAD